MIPFYAHFEQWVFLVQKDIHSLSGDIIASCYQALADDKDSAIEKVKNQLQRDFKTTLGIDPDKITSKDLLTFGEEKIYGSFMKKLEDKKGYKALAVFARPKTG